MKAPSNLALIVALSVVLASPLSLAAPMPSPGGSVEADPFVDFLGRAEGEAAGYYWLTSTHTYTYRPGPTVSRFTPPTKTPQYTRRPGPTASVYIPQTTHTPSAHARRAHPTVV